MDIADKVTGNSYTAAQWTEFKNCIENAIESTGLTLASTSIQLKETLTRYALAGDFYTDSGAADALVLTAIGAYGTTAAYITGMRCRFIANATNTTTTTANVSGLGVKTIKKDKFQTNLAAGDITVGYLYEIIYNGTLFELSQLGGIPLPVSYIQGDTLYASATDVVAKLAKGTTLQLLRMNVGATVPEWFSLAETTGGTGQTTYAQGDILYASGVNTLAKLAKGTTLQELRMNVGATVPEWFTSTDSTLTFVDTNVLNGVATPAAWTDVDLSAVVGANACLVMCRITAVGATTPDFAFRTNGETAEVGTAANYFYGGITTLSLDENFIGYIFIKTDTGGIIECKERVSAQNYSLDVIAYIK